MSEPKKYPSPQAKSQSLPQPEQSPHKLRKPAAYSTLAAEEMQPTRQGGLSSHTDEVVDEARAWVQYTEL